MGVVLGRGSIVGGRYRLEQQLGRGGMGVVWAATHTVTRNRVAMKFLRGPAHARSELRHRFLREARAATAVQHPNVVRVIDVFELDEETPVMVMDLLEGETLGQRIERQEQLSLAETAELLLPAVSAVGTAHARGVVHRDLKPDNIYLAREPDGSATVKVLDFGIAKLTERAPGATETGGIVTQTGSTLGTPCYMAPEQALAEKGLDHRVDVWAFGVILYECLSGVRPIDGDSVGQVVMRLMSTGITPLDRLVPGLPSDVSDLVGRLLSRERGKRPDDLRAVAEVLGRHADVEVPAFGPPGSDIRDEPSPDLRPSREPSAAEPEGEHRHVGEEVVTERTAMTGAFDSIPPNKQPLLRTVGAFGLAAVAVIGGGMLLSGNTADPAAPGAARPEADAPRARSLSAPTRPGPGDPRQQAEPLAPASSAGAAKAPSAAPSGKPSVAPAPSVEALRASPVAHAPSPSPAVHASTSKPPRAEPSTKSSPAAAAPEPTARRDSPDEPPPLRGLADTPPF